jgi:putative glutamine amidotransferase
MVRKTGKSTVGISGHSKLSKSVLSMMQQIRSEGGLPLILNNQMDCVPKAIETDIATIDALIVLGNDLDIDPNLYLKRYAKDDPKAQIHPETSSELLNPRGKRRARYEEILLKKAVERKIPILAICGGMQRLNVLYGGTLHQHLPDLVGCNKHEQRASGVHMHIPVLPILIKEETMLAQIASAVKMKHVKHGSQCPKVIMENAMHHQALDRIAPIFQVAAITDTVKRSCGTAGYIAMAIESDPEGTCAKQFILGVQWHPEFGASSLGEQIIRHLIGASRHYRSKAKNRLAFARISRCHLAPKR